jgi:hypothetical protein
MEEQEIYDTYMHLCGMQREGNGSKGFIPTDSICDSVYWLMDKMREAGLKEDRSAGSYFINWFFRCMDRTFSICVYSDGWMELRWG